MNVLDFFNYNNLCPICNDVLTKEAHINIWIDKFGSQTSWTFAGAIVYDFNGKKFIKNKSKVASGGTYSDIINSVRIDFPQTFVINKRFNIRVDKSKISDVIKPWFVSSFDARLMRECAAKNHYYCYCSGYVFGGEKGDSIEMDRENLGVHSFNVCNIFDGDSYNKMNTTVVNKHYSKNDSIYDFKKYHLPPIPIKKWNLGSKEAIKNQLDKYLLLK